MQLCTWAVAFSIVPARAVSAVLGSSRTVLTVSKQLPVQRRNSSHTVCLCVNLLVPLFFIFKMYVKAEEMLGISKKKRRDHGCRMEKGKCDRATVLSHQAFKEVHLVCIWHWHSQLLFIFHIHHEIPLMTSFTGVTKNYWLKHSFTVRLAKNTKIMHVAKYFWNNPRGSSTSYFLSKRSLSFTCQLCLPSRAIYCFLQTSQNILGLECKHGPKIQASYVISEKQNLRFSCNRRKHQPPDLWFPATSTTRLSFIDGRQPCLLLFMLGA